MSVSRLKIRKKLEQTYSDIYTPEVLEALSVLSPLNSDIKKIMNKRIERRGKRKNSQTRIQFLDEHSKIEGTDICVQDARLLKIFPEPIEL